MNKKGSSKAEKQETKKDKKARVIEEAKKLLEEGKVKSKKDAEWKLSQRLRMSPPKIGRILKGTEVGDKIKRDKTSRARLGKKRKAKKEVKKRLEEGDLSKKKLIEVKGDLNQEYGPKVTQEAIDDVLAELEKTEAVKEALSKSKKK